MMITFTYQGKKVIIQGDPSLTKAKVCLKKFTKTLGGRRSRLFSRVQSLREKLILRRREFVGGRIKVGVENRIRQV